MASRHRAHSAPAKIDSTATRAAPHDASSSASTIACRPLFLEPATPVATGAPLQALAPGAGPLAARSHAALPEGVAVASKAPHQDERQRLRAQESLQARACKAQHDLDANPHNTLAVWNACTLLSELGRTDEALRLADWHLHQRPTDGYAWLRKNDLLLQMRLHGAPLDAAMEAHRHCRTAGSATAPLARALLLNGQPEAALAQLKPARGMHKLLLAMVEHALGHPDLSNAHLNEFIRDPHTTIGAGMIAEVHAFRGNVALACKYLEEAIQQDVLNPFLGTLSNSPCVPDHVRDHPDWQALLRRMNRAPDQLAQIHFTLNLPALDNRRGS